MTNKMNQLSHSTHPPSTQLYCHNRAHHREITIAQSLFLCLWMTSSNSTPYNSPNIIKIGEDKCFRGIETTCDDISRVLERKTVSILQREIFPHEFFVISELDHQRNIKSILKIPAYQIANAGNHTMEKQANCISFTNEDIEMQQSNRKNEKKKNETKRERSTKLGKHKRNQMTHMKRFR